MILLVLASLIGFAITFALLWPYGVLVAVIGASFGGSSLAAISAVCLALRSSEPKGARRLFATRARS